MRMMMVMMMMIMAIEDERKDLYILFPLTAMASVGSIVHLVVSSLAPRKAHLGNLSLTAIV